MSRLIRNTLATLVVGASIMGVSSAWAKTTFIANSFYDQQHPLSKFGYTEWAERVQELSGGKLNANVFTGTVLLAPRATLQGLRSNVVQVATHAAQFTPAELPLATALQELGMNYSDSLALLLATADFSMNNPTQLAEWKKNGIVYLGAYATPPYVLMCRTPVRNLAELKGKRVRAAGASISEWLEVANAVPVNVPSSEMYTGLDRGSLDCVTNAANDLIDRSLWEVARHTTLAETGIYWAGPHWGVNAGFWRKLSDEDRATLKTATAQTMVNMMLGYLAATDSALEQARDKKNEIHQPQADLQESINQFRQARLSNIYQIAKDKYGITDPAVIDAFIATEKKWAALLKDIDRNDKDAITTLVTTQIYDKLPANYGLQ